MGLIATISFKELAGIFLAGAAMGSVLTMLLAYKIGQLGKK